MTKEQIEVMIEECLGLTCDNIIGVGPSKVILVQFSQVGCSINVCGVNALAARLQANKVEVQSTSPGMQLVVYLK